MPCLDAFTPEEALVNDDKLSDNVRRNRLIAVIVTALWLLIFCSLAIWRQSPKLFPVVSCPRTSSIGAQSPDGHFVDNQIVVIGLPRLWQRRSARCRRLNPQPVESCALDYAGQLPEPHGAQCRDVSTRGSEFAECALI